MKRIFLLLSFTLFATILYSQAKKNIGGQDLYQKGSCERVSVNFVSCTYCTDKELKNCKEYWCTDDGTCTEAPKKNQGRKLSTSAGNENIATKLKETDTTSKLPNGTKFQNGKVVIIDGYKAVYSSDKKIVAIKGNNDLGITGSFACVCSEPEVSCGISTDGGILICESSSSCCRLLIVIKGSSELTMEKIEQAPEKLKWKKLIVPTKSN
ncbi:MAG TPA: hypothetical protein PLR98_13445 [Chitinophagaceae bacterium]|nr:hypothetical protein [Chitinophagaceae bacterium]HRF25172.1 hypothetical protein [Chitinophagaceae bacterium]